jgi:hypothetical protein
VTLRVRDNQKTASTIGNGNAESSACLIVFRFLCMKGVMPRKAELVEAEGVD